MPLKKKQKVDQKEAKAAKKRRRQEEEDLGPEDDNFFLAEDDVVDEQGEADAAEEALETAEEKRLRLGALLIPWALLWTVYSSRFALPAARRGFHEAYAARVKVLVRKTITTSV